MIGVHWPGSNVAVGIAVGTNVFDGGMRVGGGVGVFVGVGGTGVFVGVGGTGVFVGVGGTGVFVGVGGTGVFVGVG
ncbi:MAG: hypothetical protein ACK4SA_21015, partial [Caldilinea sp.]